MAGSSLERHDVALVRADNPGPFTLTGTNTWVVGRDPCWVVDPGPAIDTHLAAIEAEAGARGGGSGGGGPSGRATGRWWPIRGRSSASTSRRGASASGA